MIRVATKNDIGAIAGMIVESHQDEYFAPFGETDRDAVSASFAGVVDAGGFVVADVDGVLVGVCGFAVVPLWFNPSYLMATTVVWWVRPSSRAHGLGNELLREAENIAKKQGARSLLVTVRKDSTMAVSKILGLGYRLSQSQYLKGL